MKLKDWVIENRSIFVDRDLRFLVKDVFLDDKVLLLQQDKYLSLGKLQHLDRIKHLYIQGMPLAYILGKEIFFGLEFKVDSQVLIPRKETELIVEKAIEIINKNNLYYILDLCCGCGNIAISIKKSIKKKLFICGSDVSFSALALSRRNSDIYKTSIELVNADLLKAFKARTFDLIVSNPPYVESKNIKSSLRYEPRLALEAGEKGLNLLREILSEAHIYLRKSGYLILEMGYNHKSFLAQIINEIGLYEIIEWVKDYSGHFRGVVLEKL